MRYYCAAETRNNLSAALQNLQGAQRYLKNIEFPYCNPSEIETVYKVINNIIYHDLGILEERCREKSALLRKERIRLIKDSIKNTTGKEIKLDGGKVAELRYQHNEQMKVLKRVQELRQARLSKALQRKLEARRHRKSTASHAREE
ncbi:hypothetical protein HPB50_024005 [Hyalomma asiaticum]|uniref:Uncharacterized protein n=1 Tax=Hyalomma asiaticum TaxID=266040 RepID=A0ACB7SA08_HYAAI|nr:hypothetical protein HPB50_024005 [Hyalomma asiaticum]